MVRHRNFIFGIHMHTCPPYMHIKYLVILDKVRMYEEIMMNDDNLESSLLTSGLLKMRFVTS